MHAFSNPGDQPVLAETATGAVLARQAFGPSGDAVIFALPPSLQNRIARLVLAGSPTAGGTALTDSTLHTTLAGLDTRSANAETPFLGTLYYLRRALPASTRITTGTLPQLIAAHPGLIFLTDTPLSAAEQDARPALCRGRRRAGPLRRAADRRYARHADRRPAARAATAGSAAR